MLVIYQYEFHLLYHLLYKKLVEYYHKEDTKGSLPKPDEYSKTSGYAKTSTGLAEIINADPDVEKYLTDFLKAELRKRSGAKIKAVTTSALYGFFKKFAYGSALDEMKLKGIYERALFIFLGYKDVAHFRTTNFKSTGYKGFYFSVEKQTVEAFDFFIQNAVVSKGDDYVGPVICSISDLYDADAKIILKGTMKPFREFWIASLASTEYFMNLSIHTVSVLDKIQLPASQRFLYGILSGSASGRHPVAAEFALTTASDLSDSAQIEIKRYLSLRRSYFSVIATEPAMRNLASLKVAGISINRLKDFEKGGTYRIVSKSQRGSIIQTKFSIQEDFISNIKIPDIKENLNCHIIPDNLNESRLVVNVYKSDGTLYMTTVMIFPPDGIGKSSTTGAYCIADGTLKGDPSSNKFIMRRDTSEFSAMKYNKERPYKAGEDKILDELLTELNS